MACGKEGIDLRIEARIAGCDWFGLPHGWALLGQSPCLRVLK
jgi:hypothetical protein